MEDQDYINKLASIPHSEYQRLLMGDFNAPLSPQERFREEVAKEYWDKVDAGWAYDKAKASIMTWCTLTPKELHEVIVAYGRKYQR